MAGKNGGARPGAGRKATGAKTKCYTITLPIEEAEELEKRAIQLNKSINKYLRDIIEASGQYGNVSVEGKQVDDSSNLENGHFVYEVITEKKYEFEENGHKGFKSETFVRRWEPGEVEKDLDLPAAAEEGKPYVRNS